jgi:alpha-tubulin suppressor-like RCC1 family protein
MVASRQVQDRWYVAVAASNNEAIYIFKRVSTTWSYDGYVKGTYEGVLDANGFIEGTSMAFSTTSASFPTGTLAYLITTRPSEDGGRGTVYIYKKLGTAAWVMIQRIANNNIFQQSYFGMGIAMGYVSDNFFVGASNGAPDSFQHQASVDVYYLDANADQAYFAQRIFLDTPYQGLKMELAFGFSQTRILVGAVSDGTGDYTGGNGKLFVISPIEFTSAPVLAPSRSPSTPGPTLPAGTSNRVMDATLTTRVTCMVLETRNAKCFGMPTAFLEESPTGKGDEPGEMEALALLDVNFPNAIKQIAGTFGYHYCVLSTDGLVKCWGYSAYGGVGASLVSITGVNGPILGDEPSEAGSNLPLVNLGTGVLAKQVACGLFHTCVIVLDGRVKCFGRGGEGQLGTESTDNIGDDEGEMGDSLAYTNLGTGRTAVHLSCGMNSCCALLDNGSVKCWGQNNGGVLGQGTEAEYIGNEANSMGDFLPPVDLGTDETATTVEMGGGHVCVILASTGQLKCWGDNTSGQLGIESTVIQVLGLAPGDMGDALPTISFAPATVVSVSLGSINTCVVLSTGELKCWGGASYGITMTGDSTTVLGDEPGEIASLNSLFSNAKFRTVRVAHSLDNDHACGITLYTGNLICWGMNEYGQRGINNADSYGNTAGQTSGNGLPVVITGAENASVPTWQALYLKTAKGNTGYASTQAECTTAFGQSGARKTLVVLANPSGESIYDALDVLFPTFAGRHHRIWNNNQVFVGSMEALVDGVVFNSIGPGETPIRAYTGFEHARSGSGAGDGETNTCAGFTSNVVGDTSSALFLDRTASVKISALTCDTDAIILCLVEKTSGGGFFE